MPKNRTAKQREWCAVRSTVAIPITVVSVAIAPAVASVAPAVAISIAVIAIPIAAAVAKAAAVAIPISIIAAAKLRSAKGRHHDRAKDDKETGKCGSNGHYASTYAGLKRKGAAHRLGWLHIQDTRAKVREVLSSWCVCVRSTHIWKKSHHSLTVGPVHGAGAVFGAGVMARMGRPCGVRPATIARKRAHV